MDTVYGCVGNAVDANKLGSIGSLISFNQFDDIMQELAVHTRDQNAPSMLLDHMAILGVKPAFSSSGYRITAVSGPNVESPPDPFSFNKSPFVDRPARSVGNIFYPLLKKDALSKYFAHQIRWFSHPIRPNVMMPLRMCSHFLTVEHPNSRIYVDVPVVFKHNAKELRFLRVSLNVFVNILYSQTRENGNFISLNRKKVGGGLQTLVEEHDEPVYPKALWGIWENEYLPYYNRAKDFIYRQPSFKNTALLVADHLIKFQS